ncbi:Co2+/Mg2+ efflux protein ApaG [Marinimicrobium sp. ARAG 43.8]|uniref:Co2+/Mg2+ efflux protein ApaG n=1 Tax=Marinimicrobium sp. ARAG 43.8 TaxID=3418719 RepID=UPI003CF92455
MTQDIRVSVKPAYIEQQSQPDSRRFVFAYTITIANNGEEAAQLIGRHWIILDAEEKQQEVRGIGVVGEQPYLSPGKSFTYTSGVILETETGIMEGTYQMKSDDGDVFDVPIPPFALVPPYAIH